MKLKADFDGLFCSHDQRATCIMQRSKDRSNPTPSEDSFLSSYHNMSKSCQPKQLCENNRSSPLYHSLERAAALYQRHRCTAHVHSWDSRVYHSPALIASKRPTKSSQRCPRHTNRQHDASLCCCLADSCPVHCSEFLAEELEVAALLQVPVFANMLYILLASPLVVDTSLEWTTPKLAYMPWTPRLLASLLMQASFACCALVAQGGNLYVSRHV